METKEEENNVADKPIIEKFRGTATIEIKQCQSTITSCNACVWVAHEYVHFHGIFFSQISIWILKTGLSCRFHWFAVEELINIVENVADSVSIGQCNPDSMALLLSNLRILGPQLEEYSKSTLDQGSCSFCFEWIRFLCVDKIRDFIEVISEVFLRVELQFVGRKKKCLFCVWWIQVRFLPKCVINIITDKGTCEIRLAASLFFR